MASPPAGEGSQFCHAMKILVVILILAAGCSQQSVPVENQPSTTIGGDVFSNPAAYAGQTVNVDGQFQGFRNDPCRFASSARSVGLTRGDWLVRRENNCLYVTGGTPEGLETIDPSSVGRRIEVTAQVIDGGDGKYVLRQISASAR